MSWLSCLNSRKTAYHHVQTHEIPQEKPKSKQGCTLFACLYARFYGNKADLAKRDIEILTRRGPEEIQLDQTIGNDDFLPDAREAQTL